jgi:hypothetical protein
MKLLKTTDAVATRSVPELIKMFSRTCLAHESNEQKAERLRALKQLLNLPKRVKAEDIDAIFGDKRYTSYRCDECALEYDSVVQVGETPDYESSTAKLCVGCLEKALKAAKA